MRLVAHYAYWLLLDLIGFVCSNEVRWPFHQQYRSFDMSTWMPIWRPASKAWRDTLGEKADWWFWTDDDVRELIALELPEMIPFYDALNCSDKGFIMRADLGAYAILYLRGGIYAELDTMPVRSVHEMLEYVEKLDTNTALLTVVGDGSPFVDTDIMVATRPRHPFFIQCLRSAMGFFEKYQEVVCHDAEEWNDKEEWLMYAVTAAARLPMCASAWDGQTVNTTLMEHEYVESLLARPADSALYKALQLLRKFRRKPEGTYKVPMGDQLGETLHKLSSGLVVWNQDFEVSAEEMSNKLQQVCHEGASDLCVGKFKRWVADQWPDLYLLKVESLSWLERIRAGRAPPQEPKLQRVDVRDTQDHGRSDL